MQTPSWEDNGQFSPDGRWMVYVSIESGRDEVYVQPIPINRGKWQLSVGGGDLPRWRRDGKELFFEAPDGKLMAVPVPAAGGSLTHGAPHALFTSALPARLNSYHYEPAAHGKQFLMRVPVSGDKPSPITVVLNWQAGLKP